MLHLHPLPIDILLERMQMISFILKKKSLCTFRHEVVNQEAVHARMKVVRNIFTRAMGSNTKGFDGRIFLLLQSSKSKKN